MRELLKRWREKRAREKAMRRFGWDCKCSCGRWMHATGCGRCIAATEDHWHYACDCGEVTAFALWAPIPIVDEHFYRDATPPTNTGGSDTLTEKHDG